MTAVAIIVNHRTKPGQREAAMAVWMAHMPEAVSAHPGHLAYFYTADCDDPDVIRAFQLYESQEAADAFLADPIYRAYVVAAEPYLAGPPIVTRSVLAWHK